MAILFHPNKLEPKRYRVWDRGTKTQAYFPLSSQGQKDALELEQKLKKIKQARRLSNDLGINKLFTEDGKIIGLKRTYRKRINRTSYECFSLYAKGKQTEIVIGSKGFEAAYEKATSWLMKQHEISATYEITQKLRQAKRLYWTSVKPESET